MLQQLTSLLRRIRNRSSIAQKPEDEQRTCEKVQRLMESRSKFYARATISYFVPYLACALALVVFYGDSPLFDGHAPVLMIAILVAAVCHVFESQPGQKARTFIHGLGLARLSLSVLMTDSAQHMLFDRQYVLLGRLAGAFVFGNFQLTAVFNFAFAIVNSYAWSIMIDSPASDVASMCEDWACMRWFVMQEILTTICICTLAANFEKRQWAEAQATVLAALSVSATKGFSKLLSTVYDVVFHLDSDLRLADEASDLGALLLHSSNGGYKGKLLQDYLYSESDKILFVERLRSSDPHGDMDPIRLRMRDSSGTPVYVELFHTAFDPATETCLVGIREPEVSPGNETATSLEPSNKLGTQRARLRRVGAGTPAQALLDFLDPDDTDSPSSLQDLPVSPILPQCHVMDDDDIRLSIMRFLLKLNTDISKPFCCTYHCAVHNVQKQLGVLKALPCFDVKEQMEKLYSWQCGNCCIIDDPILMNSKKSCRWCSAEFDLVGL
jgi:hypothetical protein